MIKPYLRKTNFIVDWKVTTKKAHNRIGSKQNKIKQTRNPARIIRMNIKFGKKVQVKTLEIFEHCVHFKKQNDVSGRIVIFQKNSLFLRVRIYDDQNLQTQDLFTMMCASFVVVTFKSTIKFSKKKTL